MIKNALLGALSASAVRYPKSFYLRDPARPGRNQKKLGITTEHTKSTKEDFSRKGAKHVLREVEGGAKAGDEIKWIFFTGGNGDNRDELKNFVSSVLLLLKEVSWRLGASKISVFWSCYHPKIWASRENFKP